MGAIPQFSPAVVSEIQAYVPVASAAAGTLTSYTATGFWARAAGLIYVEFFINITNAGTGTGNLNVTLPVTARRAQFLSGGENALTGFTIKARTTASSSSIGVSNYINGTVIGTGAQVFISGWYAAI